MAEILIQSRDLNCGYIYSVDITEEQARAVLAASEDDVVPLGTDGAWIRIRSQTISIRAGASGGTSELDKKDVREQIEAQLAELNG